MSKHISGIPVSDGVAIAKAFVIQTPEFNVEMKHIEDVEKDMKRFEEAINRSRMDLEKIRKNTETSIGEEQAKIFSAHLLVLQDPEYIGAIKEKVQTEHLAAESAIQKVTKSFIDRFQNVENEYMKERMSDVQDVSRRILSHLLQKHTVPKKINEEVIIVGDDLTPSDTAQLDRQFVKGFTTDRGGRTSHSAIMSRSMGIPAVVGTHRVTAEVETGTLLIVDGNDGKILIDPTEEELSHYREKEQAFQMKKRKQQALIHEKTVTCDGQSVLLAANIGSLEDLGAVIAGGAEGIGLFRTEFLYMSREQMPDEAEQFQVYKTVLEKMNEKPVVVRTLDIGGDKKLPYLEMPQELNPFLGVRAIRLCLKYQEMFRIQLRALLRASTYGNLRIMFPMITTLDEFRQAKSILLEEQEKLKIEGVNIHEPKVGMMVEIPATAIMAEQFACEVDFFSIGTNDLIQYTMAADRMNEQVSHLYQSYSPGILFLIERVISAAHREGKEVAMCGEMAGDRTAIPLLLGLGLREFSMSASSILPARQQLKTLSKKEMEEKAKKTLAMKNSEQVVEFLQSHFRNEK